MKGVRIVQVVLVAAAVVYLLLFDSANPDTVVLPLVPILPPLRVALVVVLALVIGWGVGFVPARLTAWRRGRDLQRIQKRLAELEGTATTQAAPSAEAWNRREVAVIPDRGPIYPAEDDDEAG